MKALHLHCIVAIVVLMLSGCGKGEFKEFSSAEGKFKVQMPGTPKVQTQAVAGATATVYMIEEKNGAYMVSFSDLPIPAGEAEAKTQERLDGAQAGSVANVNGKLTNSSRTTLKGKYPGRDVQADIPDKKGALHSRIYIVGQRLYMLTAVGTKSWLDSAETTKFLDSFELTN